MLATSWATATLDTVARPRWLSRIKKLSVQRIIDIGTLRTVAQGEPPRHGR